MKSIESPGFVIGWKAPYRFHHRALPLPGAGGGEAEWDAARVGFELRLRLEALAIRLKPRISSIYLTPGPWHSIAEEILLLPRDLGPRFRRAYRQRYGVDPIDEPFPVTVHGPIAAKLEGDELRSLELTVRGMVRGELPAAWIDDLHHQASRFSADELAFVHRRIEGRPERGRRIPPEANRLLAGDRNGANELRAERLLRQRRLPFLLRMLDAQSPEQLGELMDGRLSKRIRRTIPAAAYELFEAKRSGNADRILAARMECAAYEILESWPGHLFAQRHLSERLRRLEVFRTLRNGLEYRDLIARRFRGYERELILELIEYGAVSPGSLLFHCMVGYGTDEDGLRKLLSETPPDRFDEAAAEYRVAWKRSAPWYERPFARWLSELKTRIRIECDGETWFEYRLLLEGIPDTREGQLERLAAIRRHELGGPLLGARLFRHGEVRILEDHLDAANVLVEREPVAVSDEATAREERMLRFAPVQELLFLDARAARQVRHRDSVLLVTAAVALAVAVMLPLLAIGALGVAALMLCVGISSIAVRLGLKRLCKGRSYYVEEMAYDTWLGVLDGCTLSVSHLVRHAIVQRGTSMLAKTGLGRGAARVLQAADVRRSKEFGERVVSLVEGGGAISAD